MNKNVLLMVGLCLAVSFHDCAVAQKPKVDVKITQSYPEPVSPAKYRYVWTQGVSPDTVTYRIVGVCDPGSLERSEVKAVRTFWGCLPVTPEWNKPNNVTLTAGDITTHQKPNILFDKRGNLKPILFPNADQAELNREGIFDAFVSSKYAGWWKIPFSVNVTYSLKNTSTNTVLAPVTAVPGTGRCEFEARDKYLSVTVTDWVAIADVWIGTEIHNRISLGPIVSPANRTKEVAFKMFMDWYLKQAQEAVWDMLVEYFRDFAASRVSTVQKILDMWDDLSSVAERRLSIIKIGQEAGQHIKYLHIDNTRGGAAIKFTYGNLEFTDNIAFPYTGVVEHMEMPNPYGLGEAIADGQLAAWIGQASVNWSNTLNEKKQTIIENAIKEKYGNSIKVKLITP